MDQQWLLQSALRLEQRLRCPLVRALLSQVTSLVEQRCRHEALGAELACGPHWRGERQRQPYLYLLSELPGTVEQRPSAGGLHAAASAWQRPAES